MTIVNSLEGPQVHVIHSQTLTPEYWATYALTPADVDFLYGCIVEAGSPKHAKDLAVALIQHHVEGERAALRQRFSNVEIYQPRRNYRVGDKLTFPALQFMNGEVIETREGYNPDVGTFTVIRVRLSDGSIREFASNYPHPHRLNDADFTPLLNGDGQLTPEEIFEQNSEHLTIAVNEVLSKHPEFLRIGEEWFLRGMMAEVNVGHLNLAEAVLDMASGPLPTSAILHDLGLPAEISGEIQEASLNEALSKDDRFEDVSHNERPVWCLRRLIPPETLTPPAVLRLTESPTEVALNEELEQWIKALDDEWNWQPEDETLGTADSVTLILSFPHRVAGTLGWSRKLAAVLPPPRKPRVALRFRDKLNGHEIPVWLVREGRYVWGLGPWYQAHDLPAGAYIEVSRSDEEGIFWINAPRRRPRREWVRLATFRDGNLRLETAQRSVSCEVDDLMSVFVDNPQQLIASRDGRRPSVAQAVREAFPEIAKLSPQGNVHIRTLYAVVNVLMRTTPRDILYVLLNNAAYASVSDGYWHSSNT